MSITKMKLSGQEFDETIAAIEAYGVVHWEWGIETTTGYNLITHRREDPRDAESRESREARGRAVDTAYKGFSRMLALLAGPGTPEYDELAKLRNDIEDWAAAKCELGRIGAKVVREHQIHGVPMEEIDPELAAAAAKADKAVRVARLKWVMYLIGIYITTVDQGAEWLQHLANHDVDAMTPEMRRAYAAINPDPIPTE